MLAWLRDQLGGAVATVARHKANEELHRRYPGIGTMSNLHIDRANRQITLSAELAGETEPIQIEAGYAIEGSRIKITSVKVSRQWIQILAEKHAIGQSFEIPEIAVKLGLL